ncbi:MAG: hypothetical protein MZU97_00120 [Bacillus subtilis]|nr:hypothetical protein [Bacillus subtilis]
MVKIGTGFVFVASVKDEKVTFIAKSNFPQAPRRQSRESRARFFAAETVAGVPISRKPVEKTSPMLTPP